MKSRGLTITLVFICLISATAIWSIEEPLISNIPEPEEIQEAFYSGLIEYQDYIRLLDIVSQSELSSQDSLFILPFSNLLSGLSTSLTVPVDEGTIDSYSDTSPPKSTLTGKILLRSNIKMLQEVERKSTARMHMTAGDFSFSTDNEKSYSGNIRWKRRTLTYRSGRERTASKITAGNYSARLGMGLIYGYHGRLLSHDCYYNDVNKFLYPPYGGGNGILIQNERLKAVVDIDKNDTFSALFTGGAARFKNIQVSFGHSRITNRSLGKSVKSYFVSFSGLFQERSRTLFEAALAINRKRVSPALVINSRVTIDAWKTETMMWYYDYTYPSYHSGGISSRRTRKKIIDEIDFSYDNRRSGEIGALMKSSRVLWNSVTLQTALTYSYRDVDFNRVEVLIGVLKHISEDLKLGVKVFYRRDSLSVIEGVERKLQCELIHKTLFSRSRLVVRYRFDRRKEYSYYTVYMENRLEYVIGRLYIVCKLDKLQIENLKNDYLYSGLWYESRWSENLSSVIKYTYRYNRNSAANYGTVRWDVAWQF